MRRRRYLFWLLFPAVAVVELAGHQVIHARIPTDEDFRRAAEVVRSGYRQGDLVVVAPRWATRARQALGHELLPLRDQARPDEATYARLWEVSMRGARSEESRGLDPDEEQRFGGVTVRRFALHPTARTVYDFVERFDQAQVSEVGGRARECRRAGGRFRCGRSDGFRWVGTETISDLDHRPRRCVWAHPLEGARTLRVHYPRVPRAERLDGHAAVDYVPARHCGSVPVELVISIDGREVRRLRHHDCDDWSPFTIPVPPGPGDHVSVTFEVSAPPRDRPHFCFQAAMRGSP